MEHTYLRRVDLTNFTVFSRASIDFSQGLNVIVGENGTGKSHLLELLYAISHVLYPAGQEPSAGKPRKNDLQARLASKLVHVFLPDYLGRLASRQRGRSRAEVSLRFSDSATDISFSFATNSRTEVSIKHLPTTWLRDQPIFVPTRELLSIYPGFVSLYETHAVPFRETWRDTCLLLGTPLKRGRRDTEIVKLLAPVEEALDGTVQEVNGRFTLNQEGRGNLEIPLVSEGMRKFGMLARLIQNGTLRRGGALFWDEPEASINPKNLSRIATLVLDLSGKGVQIFLATHSLFLLRQIELERKRRNTPQLARPRFIGLNHGHAESTSVATADDLAGLSDVAALDASYKQSEEYLKVGQ